MRQLEVGRVQLWCLVADQVQGAFQFDAADLAFAGDEAGSVITRGDHDLVVTQRRADVGRGVRGGLQRANHGVGGSTVAHTSGVATVAPTAGTARALTEVIYKATLQTTYTNSGYVPKAAYFSPAHKVVASGMTGIAQNRFEVKGTNQGTIVGAADVYVSDFGAISHVPHYMMAGGTNVFGLDMGEIKVSYLRPFQSTPLAKTGDSMKEQLLVDATLVVEAEKACFKISDLSGG